MLCKVLPGEIFPWFVRFWNAGTCFKFCDLFPGVNNAVIVNSCLVCEEGFEVWLFCKAYCFSLFSISEFWRLFSGWESLHQQGFAVGSLLEEFPGFVCFWFAGKCLSWFQNDLLGRNLWQGLPRVFDILVLFGIKVVNFLCSGREGFQLYTRVCLASSSGLWLFRGMTSKCQVWRLLHMEQGVVRGEWCFWLWVFCF